MNAEQGDARKRAAQAAIVMILAVAFTISLAFATIVLPETLNKALLRQFVDVPTDVGRSGTRVLDLGPFMTAIEPIGYLSLAAVALLILAGFATRRRTVSIVGSFAFFLPTFGYFAATMFTLAGLGILRVVWQPLWNVNPSLFMLGDAAFLPYWLVTWSSSTLLGPAYSDFAGTALAYALIAAGLLLFSAGVFTWLYGKLQKRRLFDFWAYKYSRHPQYLGFILWNYGVLLLATQVFNPYWERQPEPTLPWVISTLLVICVGLLEENSMLDRANQEYLAYRERTHFMLPLPHALASLCTAPNRLVLGKDFPRGGRETIYTFVIYLLLILGVSAVVASFEGPSLLLRP